MIDETLIIKDPMRSDVYIYEGVYYALMPGSYDPQDRLTIRAAIEALQAETLGQITELPLEVRRDNMHRLVEQQFERILYSSVTISTVPGHVFPADPRGRENTTEACLVYNAKLPGTPEEVFWDTVAGEVTIITGPELLEMNAAQAYLRNACYLRRRELDSAINGALEPESVDIHAGWPPVPYGIS